MRVAPKRGARPRVRLPVPIVRRCWWSAPAVLLAAACARGESRPVDSAGVRTAAAGHEVVAVSPDLPDPGIRPTRPAYRAVAVVGGGTVSGTVTLDGPAPADSGIAVEPALVRACRRARVPDPPVEVQGGGVADAVVWLEGVGAGKPMPAARRYEVALDGCRLTPRVVAAAAGGTLNVHGLDPMASQLVFARGGAGGEAGRVLLRTAMSAPGQVVPDQAVLAEPGLVEARGERPGWLRGWVLVFDQPYFAATGAGGAFTLADVPPGRYTLVAWHPRLGRVTQPVTVAAGQSVGATVTLRAPGTPAGAGR